MPVKRIESSTIDQESPVKQDSAKPAKPAKSKPEEKARKSRQSSQKKVKTDAAYQVYKLVPYTIVTGKKAANEIVSVLSTESDIYIAKEV